MPVTTRIRGVLKLSAYSGRDGRRKAPPGDRFGQPAGNELSSGQACLSLGHHAVPSPGGAVLVTSPGTNSSDPLTPICGTTPLIHVNQSNKGTRALAGLSSNPVAIPRVLSRTLQEVRHFISREGCLVKLDFRGSV